MKLETIVSAIKSWNEKNDFYEQACSLLSQGVMFKVDQSVLDTDSETDEKVKSIHIYPGVLEGQLTLFMINNVMDSYRAFQRNDFKITNYIFIADVKELDILALADFVNAPTRSFTERFTTTKKPEPLPVTGNGRDRIIQWSMARNRWVRSQIYNVYGLFEAFTVPVLDVSETTSNEVYAFFALRHNSNNQDKANLGNDYTADLILWDEENIYMTTEEGSGGLYDTVSPVPPFDTSVETQRDNFYLLDPGQTT